MLRMDYGIFGVQVTMHKYSCFLLRMAKLFTFNFIKNRRGVSLVKPTDKNKDINWLICPKCNRKTRVRVYYNTVLKNFPLYCHWCKTETIISLDHCKLKIQNEPDA